VGFVDCQQRNPDRTQPLSGAPVIEPFRRYVNELQLSAVDFREPVGHLRGGEAAVDERRGQAFGDERVDLIFHQGDQGRHYHGEPRHHQRGNLETERFSATSREHYHGVAAG
jgi:hypothetical protein